MNVRLEVVFAHPSEGREMMVRRSYGEMSTRPPIPSWIRSFRYQGWTNVFELVPANDHLYATETLFGDWNTRVLMLAKDACPTQSIRDGLANGEADPWRHSQRELGDRVGVRTNERLCRFVSLIPEKELLYGSASANMLYNDPRTSRSLADFRSGDLHEFLKGVLYWVLESMPRVEWVACLGQEAWFLTCAAFGNPAAARNFKEYRESFRPVTGTVGKKTLAAFPLHHPSRVGNQVGENEWRAFSECLRARAATLL